jgi:hypothetical protein
MQTNLGTNTNSDAKESNNPILHSLHTLHSIEEGDSTHSRDIRIDNVPSPHCRGSPNVKESPQVFTSPVPPTPRFTHTFYPLLAPPKTPLPYNLNTSILRGLGMNPSHIIILFVINHYG